MATERMNDGDSIDLLDGCVTIEAFESACHTRGHMMYIMKALSFTSQNVEAMSSDNCNQFLFTGDCIFEGGVGMFFEGCADNMKMIFDELFDRRFANMHEHHKVALFYGHNYGWKNLYWAHDYMTASLDLPPHDDVAALQQRLSQRKEKLYEGRRQGIASTGNTLKDEKEHNMFMAAYLNAK